MIVKEGCITCKRTEHHNWHYVYGEGYYCGACRESPPVNLYTYDGTKKFMTNDKKWHADIKSRKMLPNGTVARFDPNGKRYG